MTTPITSRRLGDEYLQDERFVLLLDSQDIAAACRHLAVRRGDADSISGVLVAASEGEYCEAWITRYRRPFDLASIYDRVL